jgi:Family of unknown function (DUF5999)
VKPGTSIACDPHEMRREPACRHRPRCPGAAAPDRAAACVVACHPEQGWSLLCNGVVLFDDAGVLVLPGPGPVPSPGRAPALSRAA